MRKKFCLVFLVVPVLIGGCGKDSIFHRDGGTLKDSRDKHEYNWIRIGEQVWMAENLAWLPVVNPSAFESETSTYYYLYDFEGSNVAEAKAAANYMTYGVLYNWEAAKTACPSGWHLPLDAEWYTLADFLDTDQGGKMKEAGTTHWINPNEGATNESGFSALPGGIRQRGDGFGFLGSYGYFWSSSAFDATNALIRGLGNTNDELYKDYRNKSSGLSVRCLRNR